MTSADAAARAAQIMEELQAWCEEHLVGQQSTSQLLDGARVEMVRWIARAEGVEPEAVTLLNPRYENEGRTFAIDGYIVEREGVEVTFTIRRVK